MKYTSLGLHNVEIKVKYYSVIFMCMNVIFYFFTKCTTVYLFSKIKYPTNLLTLPCLSSNCILSRFGKIHQLNVEMWHFIFGEFFSSATWYTIFLRKISWYEQNIVSICKILFLMTRLLCGKRRECLWSVYTSGNFTWIFLLSELYRKRMLPWWTLNLCRFEVSLCTSF